MCDFQAVESFTVQVNRFFVSFARGECFYFVHPSLLDENTKDY